MPRAVAAARHSLTLPIGEPGHVPSMRRVYGESVCGERCGGGGEGEGGGGGGGVGGEGGCGGGGVGSGGEGEGAGNVVAAAHTVKPCPVTEPSEYQDIVAPAAIGTLCGPVVPLYRVELIVR